MTDTIIHVGIIDAPEIDFSIGGKRHHACYLGEGGVGIDHNGATSATFESDGPFTLHHVVIGKQFHWQQCEDQTFLGRLRLTAEDGMLHAINDVDVETYLKSVISSEMAATNHPELLKTHAIISRSWVLRQLAPSDAVEEPLKLPETTAGEKVIARIWDHDDHVHYDVCADDHCQRYQGITRQVDRKAEKAVEATRGLVLTDRDGKLCDTRFYKACGGSTERFSACWQDRDYHYLQPVHDPFCHPSALERLPGGKEGVMRLVLNGYDRTTVDYDTWEETIETPVLTKRVEERLHLGLGRILDLEPLQRGASGRIVWLRIKGENGSVVIGKELLIRKVLSDTHLKSSCFTVGKRGGNDGRPSAFVLHGKGWGHGVGLCQIGAAAMSLQGYSCEEILKFYFPGARIAPYS